MTGEASTDLHAGFRDPHLAAAQDLMAFLQAVDRLPGIRAIQRAMRRAMDLRPGMRLVDLGCGAGFETTRLAVDHPDVRVVGLDQNAELLAAAQRQSTSPLPNLSWRHADLADPSLPQACADVIRTERVLMYQPNLDHALDRVLRLLRPSGRLVLFELDYGGTLLPIGRHGPDTIHQLNRLLARSLPQPWAGRRVPELLANRGLIVSAEPLSFAVDHVVCHRIVHGTLRQAAHDDPTLTDEVGAWLADHEQPGAHGPCPTVFTGILTTAGSHA